VSPPLASIRRAQHQAQRWLHSWPLYHQFFSSSLPTKQNTVAKIMVFVPL
jgi:hypothetical protein